MFVNNEALESVLLELIADEKNARECGDNTQADYLKETIDSIRACFTKEAKSLEDLAANFGIPSTQVTEEGEGILFSITFHQEGIQANYAIPGEIHEVKVEGSIH